ncbi:MAG: MMPL family transporter [Myxococcota bacterium]|nr:MMPL family transporter [Myxococcota bacterium]
MREAFGRWVVRRRGTALAIVLLLTLLSALGITRRVSVEIPIDFTPQAVFIDRGPMIDRLREIEQSFGREDNDLLLILTGPQLSAAGAALVELHAEMEADADVVTVTSLQNTPLIEQEDQQLRIRSALEERTLGEALTVGAADPILSRMMVSEDGQTTVLRVRIRSEISQVADLEPVVTRLVARARTVPLPDGVTLHTTGVPFVRAEVVSMMMNDLVKYVPLTTLLFAVTICLLFRRILTGLGPLFSVLGAIIWAMGALLSAGVTLNILSVLVPVLILIIGVADGIHLVSRYREELIIDRDPEQAMGRTMRHMAVACFLTTFTTAAGFFSLLIADTRVIRDFGLQAGVAVMITWIGVMLFLPTWMAFVPVHRVGAPPTERPTRERRIFARLSSMVAARPRTVIILSLIATLLAGLIGSGVRPNSHLLEMYRPGHDTFTSVTLAEEELSGVVPIFIHIEARDGDLLDPEDISRIAALEAELRAEEPVRWTASLAGYVGRIHTSLTGEDALPESREAIAQELLLAEMSGELSLSAVVTEDYRQVRIMALCADAGGPAFVALHQDLQARAEAIFPDARVDVTGDGLIASIGIGGLITDLLSSVGMVFAVILVVMWILLRSAKLALISALPNLVPLVFTLAALGLMGADLQTSNIVSFTVAIGLAVDDTIHFLVRYRQESAAGSPDPIGRTYLGAGHAIVLTSMLLVSGFGILASSDLTTTRHFGILSSVTMIAAVLADLFLLPAMLHLMRTPETKQA